jgi:hypothetical protein
VRVSLRQVSDLLDRALALESIAVGLSELSRVVVDLRIGLATSIAQHRASEQLLARS